jgi:hypothetical protein
VKQVHLLFFVTLIRFCFIEGGNEMNCEKLSEDFDDSNYVHDTTNNENESKKNIQSNFFHSIGCIISKIVP